MFRVCFAFVLCLLCRCGWSVAIERNVVLDEFRHLAAGGGAGSLHVFDDGAPGDDAFGEAAAATTTTATTTTTTTHDAPQSQAQAQAQPQQQQHPSLDAAEKRRQQTLAEQRRSATRGRRRQERQRGGGGSDGGDNEATATMTDGERALRARRGEALGAPLSPTEKMFQSTKARLKGSANGGAALDGDDLVQPLYHACVRRRVKRMRELLAKGAAVNVRCTDTGRTPLHGAAEADNVEAVLALAQHGAQVNLQSRGGDTPLHAAAAAGHTASLSWLLRLGARVAEQNDFGETPLHVAARAHRVESVRLLLDAVRSLSPSSSPSPSPSPSPSSSSSSSSSPSSSSSTSSMQSSSPLPVDAIGSTPLHLAAVGGDDRLAAMPDWFYEQQPSATATAAAASSSQSMPWRRQPFVKAAEQTVELLLGSDALGGLGQIEAIDRFGYTPLHRAAATGNYPAMRLLLDARIDPSPRTARDRLTPMMLAAQAGFVDCVALLVRHDGAANFVSSDDRNALWFAVAEGRVAVVDFLLELRTPEPVNIETVQRDTGWTPVHVASANGHKEVLLRLLRMPNIIVDQPDADGRTPLHLAAQHGRVVLLALLLGHGASSSVRDARGRTAYDIVVEQNDELMTQSFVRVLLAPVEQWTVDDVLYWLRVVTGDEAFHDKFAHARVDGERLLRLDHAQLRKLGVELSGERLTLLSQIAELRKNNRSKRMFLWLFPDQEQTEFMALENFRSMR